ncbi:unnamed protein product [Brassicogethes aeneus]|uniref:Uncharacterized protein n=1 Tax=Brassicogethes aeneus TaxID=1431903 RepID=A0A9P0B6P6_BRAAE|nr:unnamed protein product [Brassicogethes aeneus]
MRIQDYRSLLQTKFTIDDENERTCKNAIYDNLALQTYLHGLPGHLGMSIRLQKPEHLEKAMSLVLEEEYFNYADKHYRKNSNPNAHKNNSKPQFNPQNREYPMQHIIHHLDLLSIHKIIFKITPNNNFLNLNKTQ